VEEFFATYALMKRDENMQVLCLVAAPKIVINKNIIIALGAKPFLLPKHIIHNPNHLIKYN
jgi:pyruvate/2-oxoglutarate dehydrogenase complex dihydrolipoamide dehydrogenase (E3) component